MKAVASGWAEIQKRFFEKCKRRYKKYGREFHYISVTEIQPGRWHNHRECGLHIHFLAIAGKSDDGEWLLPDDWVRESWQAVLHNCVGESEQIRLPNYKRDRVHSSSAAYLAKYFSKGTGIIEEVSQELGEEYIPHRWWSMSSGLHDKILTSVVEMSDERVHLLCTLCESPQPSLLKWVYEVTMTMYHVDYQPDGNTNQIGSNTLHMGWVGQMTEEGLRTVLKTAAQR
jgi:hypothetical protein